MKVLENPSYLTEEIKALDADRVKAESLKPFLQSSDRRKDLEVRRRIACVNQWLNHKTEIVKSGDSESEGCDDRETLRSSCGSSQKLSFQWFFKWQKMEKKLFSSSCWGLF